MDKNKKMKKKTLAIIIILVVIVALIVGAYLAVKIFNKPQELKASEFTAVYMTSGDIYFGKMSWFPRPKLQNVWYLQRGVDQQNNPQLSIAAFKKVLWSPIDEVRINPKQIILSTRIREDSELARALRDPAAVTSGEAKTQLQQELKQLDSTSGSSSEEKSPSKN